MLMYPLLAFQVQKRPSPVKVPQTLTHGQRLCHIVKPPRAPAWRLYPSCTPKGRDRQWGEEGGTKGSQGHCSGEICMARTAGVGPPW